MIQHPGPEVAAAARAAGFSGDTLVTMVAIAKAESGWRTVAGPPNDNGTRDWGVWQINDVHNPSQAVKTTLAANAQAAREVYDKQGLTAWSVYNSGTYRRFLDEARAAVNSSRGVQTVGLIDDLKKGADAVLPDVPNPVSDVGESVKDVGRTAVKVADISAGFLLGVVLIVVAVALFARNPVKRALGVGLKAAKPVGKMNPVTRAVTAEAERALR